MPALGHVSARSASADGGVPVEIVRRRIASSLSSAANQPAGRRSQMENFMIRIGAGLLAAIGLAGAAHAEQLDPMQAKSIELGDTVGVAYYTVADDAFRVVA